jgi:hypothetical protein
VGGGPLRDTVCFGVVAGHIARVPVLNSHGLWRTT